MQHRALNLLHSISPQTANYYDDVIFCINAKVLAWKKLNILSVTYREDPLGVTLGPHVGVVNLLQNHPRLVMFAILLGGAQKKMFSRSFISIFS